MGFVEDGAAGGFVYAAGFHADKSVLDNVDAADAVLATKVIEGGEEYFGRELFAVDADGGALLEFDFYIFRFVGCVLGIDG